jgi:hypothetical protein
VAANGLSHDQTPCDDELAIRLAVEQDIPLGGDSETEWRVDIIVGARFPNWKVHFLQLKDGFGFPVGI